MSNQKRHWSRLPAVFLAAILCLTQPDFGLQVSEVMYHSVDEAETLEFIELYNSRAVFEDLSGYEFTDGIRYVFPPGTIIEPKSHLVVARDPAAIESAYNISAVLGPFTGRLSNGGEQVELSNPAGEIVISLRYDDEHPWPVSPDGTGHSLILSKPGGDPDQAASWSASAFVGGTPGESDAAQAVTDGPTLLTLVDVGHPGVFFAGRTEPTTNPAGQPTTEWTELSYHANTARTAWTEGLSGYGYSNEADELQYIRTQLNDMPGNYMSVYARLSFNLTIDQIRSFSALGVEVHYDDGFVLYLNGTRVADSGQIAGNPPPFNQSGGPATDPPAANVDLTSRLSLLRTGTNVLAIQAHNARLSGSSDCFASPILRAVMGQTHGIDTPGSLVVINEVSANSDVTSGVDWIELYNPGLVPVDLSNIYLSNDPLDLLEYKMPDGTILQPGQFSTVSKGTPPSGFAFELDFADETIYLTAATDDISPVPLRVLDAVRYEIMEPEVTLGRCPDGSDRICRLNSATFAGPNSRPTAGNIVINEIMYNHGMRDDRYEFVELYNKGQETIALGGWAFTDGINYEFAQGAEMQPDSYLVIAKEPELLEGIYENLTVGANLLGPYGGRLNDHSERIRLSSPLVEINPKTGVLETYMITEDEVTYFDGGRWPAWADGEGASLELRDPRSDNDTPDAWADSDESAKTEWEHFLFTIDGDDPDYTHDQVTIFDMMLLNRGEVLIDDLSMVSGRANILSNGGFESAESGWRILGNHVQSFATTADSYTGMRSLHLIATGHGDPGANRINQSIGNFNIGRITFSGRARWLRGSRFLLLRTAREQAPVQPPRPSHAFELTMPLNLGTPGKQNTAFVPNRGPDILNVRHAPVLPAGGRPITVTARVTDNDGVRLVTLYYRSEGTTTFRGLTMRDDGAGGDAISGDGIYTATIPGASTGTMRAFYIEASDRSASTRFPTLLDPTADVPERTCLVRVGDTTLRTRFATYRIWLSNDVINTFRSRPNLSNELMDCTFVYNDKEVFYNAKIRFRGSPFLRSGSGRDPRSRYAYRIEFGPDQKFGGRDEINLDNTEGSNRGPLQERASYWFYAQMGLQYSSQEFVRPLINGRNNGIYEDVQKIDGDYIDKWFGNDTEGYLHKIDDYFEYSVNGTGHRNLDEGLKFDSRHPLLKETYRWGFEKRSHRENDDWDHLFDFAVAMNTSSTDPAYEQIIESFIHPEHFARVLAIRHAVGDWDSYGYTRGKNNYFYYALPEGKWYLLPWDIDFTLGSGNGPNTNLFSITSGEFPEVHRFLNHPKYRQMYLQAFADLVNGPWQTSYGTGSPPTAFDRFLDDAADALIADGLSDGRRNGIKQFVRNRRAYILTQVPSNILNPPGR